MKYVRPITQILALLAMCYLLWLVHSVKKEVKKLKEIYTDTVTVTTYTTDPRQTDATPYITASGFKLNKKNPKKHRVVAVSRDIKKKLNFGDKIKILDAGEYSGIYVVEDLMNKRFKNRIDILLNPKDKPILLKNIKIIKV